MENLGYLFAAYSLIFFGIFLYVLFIARRQSRLETELKEVEALFKRVREPARVVSQSRSVV